MHSVAMQTATCAFSYSTYSFIISLILNWGKPIRLNKIRICASLICAAGKLQQQDVYGAISPLVLSLIRL